MSSQELPKPGESLAEFVRRRREELGYSQRELASLAGTHLQTIGKIEGNQTSRLNAKTLTGLSRTFKIPVDYLDAVARGVSLESVQQIKICSNCWSSGSEADPIWLDRRSKYCFMCGGMLRSQCSRCGKSIESLKYRFCPYCGQPYQESWNPPSK
jgi:transcriptional regulator with XRE-family HTH domain